MYNDMPHFSLLGNPSPALRQIFSDRMLLLLSHLFRKNLLPELAQEAMKLLNDAEKKAGGESIHQVFTFYPSCSIFLPFSLPTVSSWRSKSSNSHDSGEKGRFPEFLLAEASSTQNNLKDW